MKTLVLSLIASFAAVAGLAPAFAAPTLQVSRELTVIPKDSTDNLGGLPADPATTVVYTLTNVGDANLVLTNNVDVPSSANAVCNISAQPAASLIFVGGTTTFTISIGSIAGPFTCNVRLFSSDPASPFTFTIGGTDGGSQPPALSVLSEGEAVEDLDDIITELVPDVRAEQTLTIVNVGGGELQITASTLTVSHADCSVTPSLSLAPGAPASLVVAITPSGAPTYRCDVLITSNDPARAGVIVGFTDQRPGAHLLLSLLGDRVEPDASVDLGRLTDRSYVLTLDNVGTVRLSNIAVALSGNCRLDSTALPRVLDPPTAEVSPAIPVVFTVTGNAGQPVTCEIEVTSSDRDTPSYRITVLGDLPPRGCSVGGDGGLLALAVTLAAIWFGRRRAIPPDRRSRR